MPCRSISQVQKIKFVAIPSNWAEEKPDNTGLMSFQDTTRRINRIYFPRKPSYANKVCQSSCSKNDGLQVRAIAREFQTQARASRGAEEGPQTALERLRAARESSGEDRSAEIERNVESAGVDLMEQGQERQRVLEQERALERQLSIERGRIIVFDGRQLMWWSDQTFIHCGTHIEYQHD